MVLYIPANLLPVMDTSSLFGAQTDTIMSGVVYLWTSGSWPLAVIVFIASIAVPMLKIIALIFLVLTAQLRWRWLPEQRTRIYRLVELVGRWSMLDIYVITILVALVQFNALATIKAGPWRDRVRRGSRADDVRRDVIRSPSDLGRDGA